MTGTADLTGHARAALAHRLDAPTLRRSPASVATVVHRGDVVAVSVHGSPRRDGTPTTAGTVFRVASMSKSFLAATALALRDDGLLDLHAPAVRYLPELAPARFAGEAVGETLTLDLLLSNRAGLAEDNAWGDEHLGESRAALAAIVGNGLTLATRPDTAYEYSNIGISLIGRAIEAVTGRPVEEVVQERILEPLGLAQTRAAADLYPADADLATGFRTFDDGETFTPEPYVGTGALGCIGSLFSAAADIAAWMHFLGSAFDEPHAAGQDAAGQDAAESDAAEPVLSASSRRQMQTVRTLIAPSAGQFGSRDLDGAGYGYGLVVEHDRRFGRVVQHAGGLPGFSSHMRWHPTTGIGVVVFGNSDAFGAGRIAGDVLGDVLRRLDAPSAIVRPWPQTVDAARRLDGLLRSGTALTDSAAWDIPDLLARNVLRDVPAAVRTRRLQAAVAEVGEPRPDAAPIESRVVGASDPSALRWSIPCAAVALVCDVHLVGLPGPIVQSIDVQVAGEDAVKPRGEAAQVTDHHRVDLG